MLKGTVDCCLVVGRKKIGRAQGRTDGVEVRAKRNIESQTFSGSRLDMRLANHSAEHAPSHWEWALTALGSPLGAVPTAASQAQPSPLAPGLTRHEGSTTWVIWSPGLASAPSDRPGLRTPACFEVGQYR
ncbi:hypothetical protein GGTG_12553 [Gaeumannomyces tritici R3-111a-1]|uniref:Uncharacterized protein n=1 Tax=Gaeumannomyces tritici (strain R3-111a-1) TaxID=644352 RepID=J3PGC8_GAET3|nr:hypothetical protein GGTG_12553 [Gaeumannomyces tritici R3-111a-1]EJT69669.1 hypothetical protein GGTG_12553 [Gaeumannomyces tritici R3-111a-1]